MAVAFQEDFEAVQNMAKEAIFKERDRVLEVAAEAEDKASDINDSNNKHNHHRHHDSSNNSSNNSSSSSSNNENNGNARSSGGGEHNNDDDDGNGGDDGDGEDGGGDGDDNLIDNNGELRQQLKSPVECGFAQTTSKPSLFFRILTDQDVEERKKARQERLHRAAVEIAQLEARRCAEEKHRLRRRELEQKERRLRALIMDELCSLWRKGHVFEIPEQVDPYLRGECGSDPEENEIRKRLFHGCFYEFSNRLQSSRKRFKHKRRTILETVTWTAQEIKLYYECMAKHRIPVYGPASFGAPHCSSHGVIVSAHPHLHPQQQPPPPLLHPQPSNGGVHRSTVVFPNVSTGYHRVRSLSEAYQPHGSVVVTGGTAAALDEVAFCRGTFDPSKAYINDTYGTFTNGSRNGNGNGNSSSGSGGSKEGTAKPHSHPKANNNNFEFVNELLRESVGTDSGSSSKPDSTTDIDLYDDL